MRRMRRLVACLAVALALLGPAHALADDGLRWKRTTPRATFRQTPTLLELRVPPERAWGIAAAPLELEAGRRYRARADLSLPTETLRGAFLRVALYPSADGRGRQRLVLDSALLAGGADARAVEFTAPAWARSAKLRVLARASAALSAPLFAERVALVPIGRAPPEVVLREND